MKRGVKLISLLVVLGILSAAYFVYGEYLKKQEEDNTEVEEDTTVEMLKIDVDSISAIEYNLDEEQIALKKAEEGWQWADDADFPLDQSYPAEMASFLSEITATREIAENLENKADFGLDTPYLTVKFSTNGGQEYEYVLGSYNSVANGYYATISGKDKIYLVSDSSADSFGYYVMDMVESTGIPSFDAENITKAEFKTAEGTNIVTTDSTGAEFYAEPYVFFLKNNEGKVIAVDGQAGAELMSYVANLSLGIAADFKPDDEKIVQYGLSEDKRLELNVTYMQEVESDETDTSVNVTTEESFSVFIGKYTDEEGSTEYYAMFPGSYVVYELSGGEELYEGLNADIETNLVCPVTTEEAISFKCEIGGTDAVYFYNTADIENNENITAVLDKIAALAYVGKTDGQKGELVFKTTFDVGEKELALNVYSFDGTNYIASFDVFDGLLIPVESIDGIISDLRAING